MTTSSTSELTRAIAAVRERPEDFTAWDELESLAEDAQSPDPVVELYPEVLSRDLSPVSLKRLCERALRFGEQWFADDAPLMQVVLLKVFDLSPGDEAVFQRLTVGLSAAGQWDKLLNLYARAVDATDSLERQTELLNDAVRLSRESQDDDRAIGFMKRLLLLRPTDSPLRSQLERLLERNQRWRELIASRDEAADGLSEQEAAQIKVQVAELWVEKLRNPPAAIEVLRRVLEGDARQASALSLLERLLGTEEAALSTRREALRILSDTFARTERPLDAARILRMGTTFSVGSEREKLLRSTAALLSEQGQGEGALDVLGELFVLRPEDDALAKEVAGLSGQLGAHDRHVAMLLKAADATKLKHRAAELTLRAATIAHHPLGDLELALSLCERVFADDAEPELALDAGRALDALLEAQNKHEARISVLQRLSTLEPDGERRRELLGALAKLSATRGEGRLAITTWQQRLREDPSDREALDGLIALLERQEDHAALVTALRSRVDLVGGEASARDLGRIAALYADELGDIGAALRTYRELHDVAPSAFAELEVAPLLSRAGEREAARGARVLAGLGEAYLRFVGDFRRALLFFSRALMAEPALEAARVGLSTLLEHDDTRAQAAEALATAYASTSDIEKLVALLPHRLFGASGARQRADLLRQTGHLAEVRLAQNEAALSHFSAALLEEPSDAISDADLLRLAAQAGAWSRLCEVLAEAAEKLDPASSRAGQLRLLEAELRETQLDDLPGAFEAYTAASRGMPLDGKLSEALCRTAARLGRFAPAFEAVVALAHKHDRVPEVLLSQLETELTGEDAYRNMSRAAAACIETGRLTPPVKRALLTRVAEWQEQKVGDLSAAEELLATAASVGGAPHAETLRKLVAVQRRSPGRALYDTLIAVAELSEQDLDLLVEASSVARDSLDDPALQRSALERLFVQSASLLLSGKRAAGSLEAEACVGLATTQLAELLSDSLPQNAVQVLRDAASLPIDTELRRAFFSRAAKLALERLEDRALGITLYERVLELGPDDVAVMAALGAEYGREGRLDDLLTMLQRELSLTRQVPRRLELRLEIARVMGEIEARGARRSALADNLREAPGHAASVQALENVLRQRRLLPEVYELFAGQGAQLEALGDNSRAAELWARAARFADAELNDQERALAAFYKVAALREDDEAYEALARIRLARREPSLAVPWLVRRLEGLSVAERAPVRLSLADAEREAGRPDAAIACLVDGIAEAPDAFHLRDALAKEYEAASMTEELAVLLADSALRASDDALFLSYGRRAASLFCETLNAPSRALEVLARAVEVDSEDRSLRCLLADALTDTGQLSAAKAVLDGLVLEFGRRRSPERAEVHVRLARVAKAEGDVQQALLQLDTASSMDRSQTSILRELGALAQDAGELDRAERAYRALLMIVRKSAADGGSETGAAEVLYQLHRIASAQGHEEKAVELLESAVQAAVHSEAETDRLKEALLARGEPALLIRVLELRLAQVNDSQTEAEVLSDLADVLEGLDKQDEALDVRLRALGCAPGSEVLHEATLRVAQATKKEGKYVEALRSSVDRARRREDANLVGDLALRAGTILEHVLADVDGAKEQYALVDAEVPAYAEALTGLSRIAHKRNDLREERAVLGRIIALPESAETAPYKHEAHYRAVELDSREDDTREAGLVSLMALLSTAPDYPRAAAILSTVCDAAPKDPRALAMFEQIARKSGDKGFLLDFLERHAATPEPTLALVREGAELALSVDDGARAEKLLKRAVAIAEEGEGLSEAPWAAVLLGRLYRERSEVSLALDWFERALSLSDPLEAFERGLELAELSASQGGDIPRATRIYESLREREPADRRVWGPLMDIYRREGAFDRLLALVEATLEVLIDPVDRNALRVETAAALFAAEREQEGAALLEQVLAEDPDHQGATLTLADLYERRGENEALAELLRRKLEGAVQRHSPSVVPLSLRMGGLLSPSRPDQAADVYREALNIVPDSDELLRVTISLLDPETEAAERADLVERYLSGGGRGDDDALPLALWLLDQRIAAGDEVAVERALATASRVAPGDEEIAVRLERWYRAREDFPRLAEYLEVRADREPGADKAVALLMEAAEVRLEQLSEPSAAAHLLRKARERKPGDFELLTRAVHASAAAGDLGPAMAEVDTALEESTRSNEQRVELLLLRAEVAHLAGMHDDALASLDSAHALDPDRAAQALLTGLDLAREAAHERGSSERERELVLRLVEHSTEGDALQRAIDLLGDWTARAGDDVEANRLLLRLLHAAKRDADAVAVAESLIRFDQPAALPACAAQLLSAARALGNLELSRSGLELAVTRSDAPELVSLLSQLYEELDDKPALAALLGRHLSKAAPAEKRAEELRRIGRLLLESGDVEGALLPLTTALELKPDDVPTVLFIADAHIGAQRFQEAQDLLEQAMTAQRQRRSPELALLRHRMARLSAAAGDREAHLEWLNAALEADLNNGEIASETAIVAQDMGQFELALKALRAITMLKGDMPMSRAEAFYRQAQIVARKGESRRAVLWAKKAKAEDADLPGVDALLAELGEA